MTSEALGFVQALQHKILMKIVVSNIQQCKSDMQAIGLPGDMMSSLERLAEVALEGDVIFVLHRDPGEMDEILSKPTREIQRLH